MGISIHRDSTTDEIEIRFDWSGPNITIRHSKEYGRTYIKVTPHRDNEEVEIDKCDLEEIHRWLGERLGR